MQSTPIRSLVGTLPSTLVGSLYLASGLCAQAPSAVAISGDPVNGLVGPAGTIGDMSSVRTNDVGGYTIFTTATISSNSFVSVAYGNPGANEAGGPARVLFQEGAYFGLDQTSWTGACDIDDFGHSCYGAVGNNGPNGFFDSLWFDSIPFVVDGSVAPLGFWHSVFNESITPNGVVYFSARTSATQGASFNNGGLFHQVPGTPPGSWVTLIKGGDSLPNLPFPVGKLNPVVGAIELTNNLNYICKVQMDQPPSSSDDALVMNGAGLLIDGVLVREGEFVAPAAGGLPSEVWESFNYRSLNDAGDYFFTGQTSANSDLDQLLVKNGSILYREGSLLDGKTLSGNIAHADINDDGDLAFAWGSSLYVNDRLLLESGDPVDVDGDGLVEPGATIQSLNTVSLAIGEHGDLYLNVFVDTTLPEPDVRKMVLRIAYKAGPPEVYCVGKASSSGCLASLSAEFPDEAPVSGTGDYQLFCDSVQANRAGIFFWGVNGRGNFPFSGSGTLCVFPPLGRTPIQFSSAPNNTCLGSYALTVNDPQAIYDMGPGTQTWFQTWYRDPALGDGFDSALSNAIEVGYN